MPPCLRLLATTVCLLLSTASTSIGSSFEFTCPQNRYASFPLGDFAQFPAPITAIPPQGTMVEVIFEAHVPDTWVAQWCHDSASTCYFGSAIITIPGGVNDAILVEFIPDWEEPGIGYVNVTIRSLQDEQEVSYCTFTCFNGLPVPNDPQFVYDCSDNTIFLDEPESFIEFFSLITNQSSQDDSLIVHYTPYVPAGWFVQFCQVSSGTCYPEDAVIEVPANTGEILGIEFIDTDYGIGYADFRYLPKTNPSLGVACRYRVYVGYDPAGAPDPVSTRLLARAEPNPFRDSAVLRLAAEGATPSRLQIFASDGRLVRTFSNLNAGGQGIRWDGLGDDGQAVPSGVYFYRFDGAGANAEGMVVRIR